MFIDFEGLSVNVDILASLLLFSMKNEHGIWIFINSSRKDGEERM
jgi:hypothetical protein